MEDANAKDSVIEFLQTVGPKLDKQLMPENISEELIQSVLGRRDLLTGTDDRAANVLSLYAKALQELTKNDCCLICASNYYSVWMKIIFKSISLS